MPLAWKLRIQRKSFIVKIFVFCKTLPVFITQLLRSRHIIFFEASITASLLDVRVEATEDLRKKVY